jgi:hypothetical protein
MNHHTLPWDRHKNVSGLEQCSVIHNLQMFLGGPMFYLRYLSLFVYSGVQHILCSVLFSFSSPCVPYIASFSVLYLFDCPFGNLWRIFNIFTSHIDEKISLTFVLTSLSLYIFTIWQCIAYNRFCRNGIYFDKILVSEYKLFKRSNKANLFIALVQ